MKDCYMIEGHANYDEHGKDIVCAGVSALAQATQMALSLYAETDVTNYKNPASHKDYYKVEFDPISDTKPIMDVFDIGVSNIANAYPDHVKFIMESDLNE